MKKGIDKENTCETDSAYIIPVIIDVKYFFRPFSDFYISSVFGAGMNYTSLDYIEPVSEGAYKLEHTSSLVPSLSGDVQLGYSIIRNEVSVFASVEYMDMFERYMTTRNYIFNAGVEYYFMTLGRVSGICKQGYMKTKYFLISQFILFMIRLLLLSCDGTVYNELFVPAHTVLNDDNVHMPG